MDQKKTRPRQILGANVEPDLLKYTSGISPFLPQELGFFC
jgi:hypothetical protein